MRSPKPAPSKKSTASKKKPKRSRSPFIEGIKAGIEYAIEELHGIDRGARFSMGDTYHASVDHYTGRLRQLKPSEIARWSRKKDQ